MLGLVVLNQFHNFYLLYRSVDHWFFFQKSIQLLDTAVSMSPVQQSDLGHRYTDIPCVLDSLPF